MPVAIRRRIVHEQELPGGMHLFSIYSRSRPGKEFKHRQEIDLSSGAVHCNCEHFRFRFRAKRPLLTQKTCHHVAKAVGWLVRHRYHSPLLLKVRPCFTCGQVGAQYDMCDDEGRPTMQFICTECVEQARNEKKFPPCPYCGNSMVWNICSWICFDCGEVPSAVVS